MMKRFHQWIHAWLKLAEAVVTICTFVYIRPEWSTDFCLWSLQRRCREQEE